MNIADVLNGDKIRECANELANDTIDIDKLTCVAMMWQYDGEIKHRLYGSKPEIVGILTIATKSIIDTLNTSWD